MTDPAVTETVIEQGKALVRAIEGGFWDVVVRLWATGGGRGYWVVGLLTSRPIRHNVPYDMERV